MLSLDYALPSGRTIHDLADACDTDGAEPDTVTIVGSDLYKLLELAPEAEWERAEVVELERAAAANWTTGTEVRAAIVQSLIEQAVIYDLAVEAGDSLRGRVGKALDVALSKGWHDGEAHHLKHAIDQIVRALAGDDEGYALLMSTNPGWDEGIPA